ncbi:MAG: DUF975 family protein [Verrucomicrobiota bacterium]
MYIIIGGDQKEYGPITADDVRQWIAEGRLNEQSLIKAEGDAEFRPLATFSEFGGAFTSGGSIPKLPPSAFAVGLAPEKTDYELDLGGCLTRGWELVKNNMGLLFVGALIYMLIEGAVGGLAQIPLVGGLFSIANFIISGPLMGGVFYLFIRAIRGEPAEIGDIFSGFRRAFGQLFLGTLVQGLFIGLCLLPVIILVIVKFLPLVGHLQSGATPDKETVEAIKSALVTCLPLLLVCAIPATYLSVCWKFTLPLIMDQQLDFWTAMGASRKMVNKHWWQIFGLVILISLLNLAGLCVCCVGVLFTFPVGIAALMFAYETIFSEG